MPLAKRGVQPVRLGRRPLGEEAKFDLDQVASNCLAGALRQLAGLVTQADDLFAELTQEFINVSNRTQRLKKRVQALHNPVKKLNPRAVKVPEGDLELFSVIPNHYRTEHGYESSLFTPASRPDCISQAYRQAELSPLKTIRKCNLYRTDGKTGSKIFSVPLVLQNEKYEDPELLALETQKVPQIVQFERKARQPRAARPRPHSLSALSEFDVISHASNIGLPTPEERLREISRSQPVTLIPIDVTGSGFSRMCYNRESIRSINREYAEEVKGKKRRSKRRQTVSGVPGYVFEEIAIKTLRLSDLRTRSASRERWERPRSMVHIWDTYDPRKEREFSHRGRSRERKDKEMKNRDDSPITRSCSLRRSLRSLFHKSRSRSRSTDLWADGRPKSPGPPTVDLTQPLRRSRSLPKSLKSIRGSSKKLSTPSRSASTEGRLDGWCELEAEVPQPPALVQDIIITRRPAKTSTGGRLPGISRSRSHGVLRYSTFQSTWDDPDRPRSMLIRPEEVDNRPRPIPVATPVTPSQESLSSTLTQDSSVTSQSHLNIPTEQSWHDLASVRLRQSIIAKDDRQSSSGNWSGSSCSARQSLESDPRSTCLEPDRHSQTSMDKDSALSLNIHSSETTDDRTTENNDEASSVTGETSTVTGDNSTLLGDTSTIMGDDESVKGSMADVKASFTRMNSEDWLASMGKDEIRAQDQKLASSSSTDSILGLTRQNLRAHDYAHLPMVQHMGALPDEQSSSYSVDQDGFYTSMHKDSGLKRSRPDLTEGKAALLSSFTSAASDFSSSDIIPIEPYKVKAEKSKRRSSLFSGFKKLKGSKKKKNPPPPPPRISTVLDKSNLTLHLDEPDLPPPPTPTELQRLTSSNETVGSPPGKSIRRSRSRSSSNSQKHDSSFESDAEQVYARLKVKTSISSAGFPSMVSVTPVQSDEEDGDLLSYNRSWKPESSINYAALTGSLKSTKSAPGTILETHLETCELSFEENALNSKGLPVSPGGIIPKYETSVLNMKTGEEMDGYSTWPRSPPSHTKVDKLELNVVKPALPPRRSLFGPPRSHRRPLPNPNDPVNLEDIRPKLGRNNSFKGSSDGSMGSESTRSSSLKSPSISSIPSSSGSDEQQGIPCKYPPMMKLVNGAKGHYAQPKGKAVGIPKVEVTHRPPGAAVRDHIYANVIVLDPSRTKGSASLGRNSGQIYSPPVCMVTVSTVTVTTSSSLNSQYASTSVTSTWPRGKAITSPSNSLPSSAARVVPSVLPITNSHQPDNPGMSTFPRKNDKNHCAKLPSDQVTTPEKANEGEDELVVAVSTAYSGPVPASAKLIISSPVAGKASFKQNPYKRSVCSPVSNQELLAFGNYSSSDKWYNALPRKGNLPLENPDAMSLSSSSSGGASSSDKGIIFDISRSNSMSSSGGSQTGFPGVGGMKHSKTFPIEEQKKVDVSNYGRSWYDGIDTNQSAEMYPSLGSSPTRIGPLTTSLQPQLSFTNFLHESGSTEVPFGIRRDSISSSQSADSGSKKNVTFASIKKASPTNSKVSLKIDENLPEHSESGDNVSDRPVSFVSFSTPSADGCPLKRSASVGAEMKPFLKTIISHPDVIQIQRRPTSLALPPPSQTIPQIEPSPKKIKVGPQSSVDKNPSSNAPVVISPTTQNRNSVIGTGRPPAPKRQSSIRIPYPGAGSLSPTGAAGKRGKGKILVSAQRKSPTSPNQQPQVPSFVVPSSQPWSGVKTSDSGIPFSTASPSNSTAMVTFTTAMTSAMTPVATSSNAKLISSSVSPGQTALASSHPVVKPLSPVKMMVTRGNGVLVNKPVFSTSVGRTNVNLTANMDNAAKPVTSSPDKSVPSQTLNTNGLAANPNKYTPVAASVSPSSSSSSSSNNHSLSTTSVLSVKQGCTIPADGPFSAPYPVRSNITKPTFTNKQVSSAPTSNVSSINCKTSSNVTTSVATASSSERSSPTKTISSTISSIPSSPQKPKPLTFFWPKKTSENTTQHSNSVASKPPVSKSTANMRTVTNPSTQRPKSMVLGSTTVSPTHNTTESSALNWNKNLASSSGNLSSSSLFKSSNSLAKSTLSLAKSTDSLASTGSTSSGLAEKTRAAKLAFLNGGEAPAPVIYEVEDRFAKFNKGRKSSTTSQSSISDGGMSRSSSVSDGQSNPTSPTRKPSPVQGRFVNAMINQYLKKSMESLNSLNSASTPSSGIGSSLANSPTTPVGSPVKKQAEESTSGHKPLVNGHCNGLFSDQGVTVNDISNFKQPHAAKDSRGPVDSRRKLLADIKNFGGQDRRASVKALEQKTALKKQQPANNKSSGSENRGVFSILDSIKNSLKPLPQKNIAESGSIKESLNSSSEWE